MLLHKIDENVSLRLFNMDDAEEFYQLTINSKDYLKQWLGWLDHIKSVEDTAQFIKLSLEEMVTTGGYPKSFAIIYQGKIAGTIGYNHIDKRNRIGVVGYWLGEEFQGKGIMSKSFKALIDYGFKKLNLNRIEVRVATDNKKVDPFLNGLALRKKG